MKENQQVEWKRSWRDQYLKWLCGFANAEGGVLVIGRDDKGAAVGVEDAARLMDEIPNKVRDILGIMVDVNLREEDAKELVEIQVQPYPSPISYKGEYFYRAGSTNQMLKGAALDRFLLRKHGLNWDAVPLPGFAAASCDDKAFQIFRREAARSGRVDQAVLQDSDEVLLENLRLTQGDYLKRAAALLFAEEPDKFVSGAYVKIGFFVTDDDLRYQDEVHGSLFVQAEEVLKVLKSKYLKAYVRYEGIYSRDEFLFPIPAVREAVLNALVHKDYSRAIPIQISVYDHQIVIWNPGQLPDEWTLNRLLGKHPSEPFNPLVAHAFFRAGYIEAWGRGIEKIHRECREYDVPPPDFDPGMSGLMLTFHANPRRLREVLGEQETAATTQETAATTQETAATTQETTQETAATTRQRIVALLEAEPTITRRELAERIGITPDGIKYHLEKLRSSGSIRHVGPTKAGCWEVLK